jgi:23S rRNA (adenine2503-C2)-methyltransferase
MIGEILQKNLMDLFPEEIEKELSEIGEKPFRGKQIFRWLSKGIENFCEMTDISKELQDKLQKSFYLGTLDISGCLISKDDKTRKYIFTLKDGNIIESVLMYYKHGVSACISTQVGCKMGCKFCASTGVGFVRDLSPGEMLSQIITMQKDAGERVSNIVLMGIGEPLDNFDNVEKFLRLVNHKEGLNVGLRHISISTCGLVPQIQKLMERKLQVTLSISLHAAKDDIRSSLMPINNTYSIDKVLSICKIYTKETGRRISMEYALIKGVNDSEKDAMLLSQKLKGLLCHVNLIPINEVIGTKMTKSNKENVLRFKNILIRNGLNATVRRELGTDINAACGQLRRSIIEKEKTSGS